MDVKTEQSNLPPSVTLFEHRYFDSDWLSIMVNGVEINPRGATEVELEALRAKAMAWVNGRTDTEKPA